MSAEKNDSLRIKTECVAANEEEDEIDETKRKSRNLSEKKRRDQFNKLINELNQVVTCENRKVDKSTILKAAINNLKIYHQNVARAKEHEINEEWKPSFLTNDEYTYLMLQSVGGFVIVFSSCGKILYISNSLATVFGYSVDEVLQMNIYNLVSLADRSYLENLFLMCGVNNVGNQNEETPIRFCCQFLHKSSKIYEPVELVVHIKEVEKVQNVCPSNEKLGEVNKRLISVGLVKLLNPMLYNEIILQSHLKNEFISHHNFEWKFLFLDETPSIIGYSPFELLGTSGYDYYHVDDLDNVTAHHKLLMVQDEGVSGYYRFMTKGHQWIWLQTTSYINRRHWNSRVEFVVCTHRVVNPWSTKSDHETEAKMDTNPSYSSGSSTGTGCSNLTSPPSWPSTTSESNFCDEDDGKEVGRVSRTYQEGFAEPEDNSLSSGQSSYEMGHYQKKRKMLRRHRVSKSTNYSGSSDTSSTYTYSLTNSMGSRSLENDVPPMLVEAPLNYESTSEPCSTIEDALQKKCFELEQIIADRKEELRALNQQLFLARSNSHQNKDTNLTDISALNRNMKPNTFRMPSFMPQITPPQSQEGIPTEQVFLQHLNL